MKYKFLIIILFIIFMNTVLSAEKIDLTESDLFVREGFNKAWINLVPSENDKTWQKFPARKGDRPVRVRHLNFKNLPKFKHFSIKKYPIMTFTYVTSFEITDNKINSKTMGLFLGQIGQNWEIYLNGQLLKSEIHLSKNKKKIIIERAVRNELIAIKPNTLKAGQNILAFKIIGNPIDDRTGLYMKKPYVIDLYENLDQTKEYLIKTMMIAIYVFFGVYHIFLFLFRPKDKHNLAFGIFAITASFYFITRVPIIFSIFRDSYFIKQFELVSFTFTIPTFIILTDLLVKHKISKLGKSGLVFSALATISIIFLWPETTLRIVQISVALGFLYIYIFNIILPLVKEFLFINSKLINEKNQKQLFNIPKMMMISLFKTVPGNLFLGVNLLFLTSIIDIIRLNKGIPSSYFAYGYFLFQAGIALILSNRFVKIHNRYEELNLHLEKIVNDRTKKLKEANLQLKELDRLKTDFFANISHEIRTPLTLILSPVESVLQDEYNKIVDKEFAKDIQKNAIRLLRLVNNILDFSKIEEGKMKMRIQEIDIVKIIKNYIKTLGSSAESKGIDLSLDTDLDSLLLYIDTEKADKIAMNLYSNALKFTEKGGKIIIRLREDGDNFYIHMEDSGVGIPENMLDSIFERFSQVDGSSSRKYEGTGIGLSLAKELAVMHGGSISVQSKHIDEYPDEHGSIFTVTFRKGRKHFENRSHVEFITVNEVEKKVLDRKIYYGLREMIDFKNDDIEIKDAVFHEKNTSEDQIEAEILIVEDNADMRSFLKTLLENIYSVHFAVDGLGGIKKARELQPDLIITDVMMPNMDGYQMTRTLKEDEELKRIPIIMLTAKAEISYKIEGLEYGADDYLTKPFNSKELLVRIKNLLEKREFEQIISERNFIIEEELETAKLLQQKLLPEKIPEVSGYESHVTYIPMDKVGGDFYDYKVEDNTIELFISDVSGHGLPGAFLSMITKMALESITNRSSTSNVLKTINDVICKSTVKDNFVTAFYCKLDKKTNILKYTNAGHFPPLVYRKKGDVFFELTTKGQALGWVKNIELNDHEIQLSKGDRLLLYTDGIIECRNREGNEFGIDNFMKIIRTNNNLKPDTFSKILLEHLKNFSGQETFNDDLCLIVLDIL